jgi:adenylosuccinate lyase
MTREEALQLVQRQAMKSWEEGADFEKGVRNDPEIKKRIDQLWKKLGLS